MGLFSSGETCCLALFLIFLFWGPAGIGGQTWATCLEGGLQGVHSESGKILFPDIRTHRPLVPEFQPRK